MNDDDQRTESLIEKLSQRRITRRDLVKRVGALTAATTAGAVLSSCEVDLGDTADDTTDSSNEDAIAGTPVPLAEQYPEVPFTPMSAPDPTILQFFTPREADMVDTLTARILPGTSDDPGAHEAGVVTYIDNLLAAADTFPEKTYRHAPYAMSFTGPEPPANSPYQVIWVSSEDIERYGYQSILTPQDVYRIGLAAVERYSMSMFSKSFVDLSEQDQDSIIGDMAAGNASGFDDPALSSTAFFHTLRRHTSEGMFSDPVYGGNRDLVGWKLVGYPGAQRAYSPDEIRDPNFHREPQSIMQMMPFNPGQKTGPNVILPVTGSDD